MCWMLTSVLRAANGEGVIWASLSEVMVAGMSKKATHQQRRACAQAAAEVDWRGTPSAHLVVWSSMVWTWSSVKPSEAGRGHQVHVHVAETAGWDRDVLGPEVHVPDDLAGQTGTHHDCQERINHLEAHVLVFRIVRDYWPEHAGADVPHQRLVAYVLCGKPQAGAGLQGGHHWTGQLLGSQEAVDQGRDSGGGIQQVGKGICHHIGGTRHMLLVPGALSNKGQLPLHCLGLGLKDFLPTRVCGPSTIGSCSPLRNELLF